MVQMTLTGTGGEGLTCKKAYRREQGSEGAIHPEHKHTMREHTAFAENLIQGRIAETIFELMCREATACDVYPLGDEQIIPILCQFRDDPIPENGQAITRISENLHNTPDFLLYLSDKTQVY
jgi:hypothetical protein